MTISSLLTKPTLLLNKQKAIDNIKKMLTKANQSGVCFRPHFKTHQSAEIGEWFRELGVKKITVSSIDMAQYFADHGWQDITIAFPINLRQLSEINQLAAKIKLNLLVASVEATERLVSDITSPVHVWLKIDVGYHRTGLDWQDYEGITAVAHIIARTPTLKLAGLLTHAGQSYQARNREEALEVYNTALYRLQAGQASLRNRGIETALSIGDTPTCSLVHSFDGVDEIRPGNFVFYDLMQAQIGACTFNDIAIAVACPVIAKHRERGQIILYGGAVHFSKEQLWRKDGTPCYGRLARMTHDGWEALSDASHITALTQEHGIAQVEPYLLNRVHIGDYLIVLPVHACLTANLLKRYLTLDGQWVEMMQ
ncbi:MAG: alanine racemase [Chloroflexi bacterium]|nr:MAG: alanine racemase [Chloroflexota bacterium]